MHPLSVTLIQSNLVWENKAANLAQFSEKIQTQTAPGQLVILPEMFSTGFSMNPAQLAETMDGPTVQWMKTMAAEKKIILTGSAIIEEEGHFYNRLLWVLPNGTVAHYNKRHLFAFAGENQFYAAGNKRLIAAVNGWKINLQICYDLRFPELYRLYAKENVDMIIDIANWPDTRIEHWRTLLKARAIENQCYVAGVNRAGNDPKLNYNGFSSVFDPMGKEIVTVENAEKVIAVEIDKTFVNEIRKNYPFWKISG